jgi:hypothetical protein
MWRIANNFTGNWTNKMGNVTDWWFNKHFEGGRATLTRAHYNNYKKNIGTLRPHAQAATGLQLHARIGRYAKLQNPSSGHGPAKGNLPNHSLCGPQPPQKWHKTRSHLQNCFYDTPTFPVKAR